MHHSIKILFVFLLLANLGFAQNKGCLMTETIVSKQDQPISKVSFVFDKHDNVLSRETIQYFDGVGVSSKVLYEYNAKNKPVKTQYFFKNQLTRTVNSVYDASGNLLSESESKENKINQRATKIENKLEQVFFNEDGSVTAKHVSEKTPNMEVFTKYDAQNNLTSNEKKILSTSGKVVENHFEDYLGKVKKTEKFIYNSDDKMVRSESYLDDVLDNYTVYDYFEGKLLKMTAFTKDNKEDYRLEMKYTGNNETEVISYYRNELANRKVKEYDADNNCVKETSYTKDGQIITVATYKYTCKK
jgi:antitoxin component YwqK of YwqJK toxin-antitoxin module